MSTDDSAPERNKGGRPKGSLNYRTRQLIERMETMGFDPLDILAQIAMQQVPCRHCGVIKGNPPCGVVTAGKCTGDGFEWIDLDMRANAAAKAAPYLYPTIRAVEVTAFEGDQDLTAAKMALMQSLIKALDE